MFHVIKVSSYRPSLAWTLDFYVADFRLSLIFLHFDDAGLKSKLML